MRSFEPFRLDVENQCLWRGDARVPLMPKPFAVLQYLVEHPGRLITHDQLLEAIWPDTYVQPEVLRRYILEIRRALGDRAEAPQYVQTLPKRGYQFIAPVVEDSAPPAAGSIPGWTRLVGRSSALNDLDECLRSAARGRREVVFVVGEPGIGKTSLLDAFQRVIAAAGGTSIARGQSVEGFAGKEPYYPLLEALGQLARGPSRMLVVDTLATHAPTWLIQFPALIRPDQHAALQREIAGATRERMVRELCEALEVLSQATPLVLILEDLHWVDHSTVDVISAVARRRESAKLLLIGTFRPADLILSESPLKALKQDLLVHRLGREIELDRLRESDVAEYIAVEFASGDLPAGLAPVIHRHSDGNPLFMTAMLDHLVQRGVLSSIEGRWTMSQPLEQVDPGVPETLRQMLEIQLQHATDAEQQILKCASVAGQTFNAWSVGAMLDGEPATYEPVCEALAERQQFLKFSDTRELADGTATVEYQFRHALYREILYRRLTPSQRLTFHRRLAEGLEALCSPAEPEMAAKIALHFEEGHEHERAIPSLLLAAQNASRRYAHREAVAVLEHARGLLSKIASDRRQRLELQILERIGNAYYALGDMKQSAITYEEMATHAAESGLFQEQADALMRMAHPAESIPFFRRAVELDPNFVGAYTTLSRIYSNLGESGPAREFARKAFEQRDRVGEREQLSIAYQYHFEATGDQVRATETLEEWQRRFPLEFQPVNSLALIHNFLGRFESAVEAGSESVKRDPSHGYPYSNLAHAYRGLGRFDEARKTAERAVALEIETLPTRRLLFQLALLAGDEQEAAAHLAWAKDKPREFDIIGAKGQAEGWAGRVREARHFYEDAARMADRRDLPEVGTSHLAWATSMEFACGNINEAVQLARRVIARSPGYDSQLRAALILGVSGAREQAEAIADALMSANPEHTLINSVLVPIVRAGIELGNGQPSHALEHLAVVAPYELGFIAALIPVHLRGLSYLMLGSGIHAAKEFQRILDHRGTDPFSPFHAVAPLGLARARALAGDIAASVDAYERFLNGWRGADSDVPVLRAAREECRRLTSRRT